MKKTELKKIFLLFPFLIGLFVWQLYSAYNQVRDQTIAEFNRQQILHCSLPC